MFPCLRFTDLRPTKGICSPPAATIRRHGRQVKATTDSKTHSESLRQEFNRWAEAGRGEGMEQDHLPIVLPVLDRMRLAPEDNVLDLGCGAGWLARLLAEQVPEGRVVGVDLSDEMIRRARRNNVDLENAMFVVGEAEEIPWDASFFTHAISVEAAYYWPDPLAALREVRRVLREGGSAWLLVNYYRENVHAHQWGKILSVPTHLFSAGEWAALFVEAGFTGVQHERISDPTPAPEKYEGRWFRDAAELRAFRQEGALLVWGTKSEG
jgi:SAM-dependent methyltransferase